MSDEIRLNTEIRLCSEFAETPLALLALELRLSNAACDLLPSCDVRSLMCSFEPLEKIVVLLCGLNIDEPLFGSDF